jgi:hypothetical protein
VAFEIHPREGLTRASRDRVRKGTRRASEREHAAVVIWIRVHVHEPRLPAGEGATDRLDRSLVSALGDVRYGEQSHASWST